MKKALFTVIFSAGLLLNMMAQNFNKSTNGLKAGDKFPSGLGLTTLDYTRFNLDSAMKNKQTLLIVYKADWSSTDVEQLHEYNSYYKMLTAGEHYQIIAITTQPVETMKETKATQRYKFPLMQDEGGVLIGKLGLSLSGIPIPSIVIIDKNGVIRYLYTNTDVKNRPITEEVVNTAKEINATYNK